MKNRYLSGLCLSLRGKHSLIFFSGLLFLYFIPLLLNGQDSNIIIRDNLDSEVVWRVVLSRDNFTMNESGIKVVPQIMDGIPRSNMISDLNVIMLLFRILNPFHAYLINFILVHLIAFIGMYLLTSHYMPGDQNQEIRESYLNAAVSFAFAILPFYTMYGLAVAGVPLLLFVFLNIINQKARITDYLIIILFPFYSFLFMNGIILTVGLLLVLIYFLVVKKIFVKQAFFAWLLFSLLFLVVEHDFLSTLIFDGNFISHRAEWNLSYLSSPLGEVIIQMVGMFLRGQYHAPSYHGAILIIGLIAIAFSKERRLRNLILVLFAFQAIIAFIYGIFSWDKLIFLKTQLGVLSSFNWGRFHWLSPFMWYSVFFLSLLAVNKLQKPGWIIKQVILISFITVQVLVNLVHNPEYTSFINQYVKIANVSPEKITYRQFFSENLFARIAQMIGEPKEDYRVVSIGIHPSIAQYNGFYTLDGYQNYYPLAYKQQFRKLIARELEKNKTWQEYFDYWGSRCYLFSSEIPDQLSTKDKGRVINHLDIDTQVFKEMGGRYIFSGAEIMNSAAENLITIGVFEDKDSVWRIYVYGLAE